MVEVGENEKKLLKAALKAIDNAYVLWGFRVGAATLAEDGKIYGGCNVESWVSGLGVCAERCAINHAILHGNRKIKEIKIVTAKTENGRISFETVKVKTLGELLPYPFRK